MELTESAQRAQAFVEQLQDDITAALEAIDGEAVFVEDKWERDTGGGGRTRVITDGRLFEKGGVNTSVVWGDLPESIAKERGPKDDPSFFATGVSLVLHPLSPHIPTTHANFRYLERGAPDHPDHTCWFGGGSDLTPYYLVEDDARHFHQVQKDACDRHDPAHYPRFKAWCDDYFYVKHRGEARGVGGLFFDWLGAGEDEASRETWRAFWEDAGRSFLPSYLPIVERRQHDAYGEREREWQQVRRGRYVEFNLVYDRGTVFGLKTKGRIESILMSLPPTVRWVYDHQPAPGSPEAALVEALRATRDWV